MTFNMKLQFGFLLAFLCFVNGKFHDKSTLHDGKSWKDELPRAGGPHLDKDVVDPYYQGTEKRGLAGFLMGATLALTLTNVATDIFLANGGCCKIQKYRFSDACSKIDKIKKMSTQLGETGKEMDRLYLKSQGDVDYLANINSKSRDIQSEVTRLRELEREIIDTMDTELVKQFQEKASFIKEKYQEGKEAISKVTAEDIERIYQPLYATWQGRVKLFGNAGLHLLGEAANFVFERRVISKIKKDIDPGLRDHIIKNSKANGALKARKLLGATDDLDDLARSMAKVKNNMVVAQSARSKWTTRFTTTLSVLSIGVEIYELFNKFKTCHDSLTKVHEAQQNLETALGEASQTLKEIKADQEKISQQYLDMKALLTNRSFIAVIEEFRQFIRTAAPAARSRMRQADVDISLFLEYINTPNPSLTSSLQDTLIQGLSQIEIKYKCIKYRVQAIARIGADCKLGVGNLTMLYEKNSRETNLNGCVNKEDEPFTTLDQMKSFIAHDSNDSADHADWYNPNCLLNNNYLTDRLCREKCVDGHTYQAILADYPSINEEELKKICEPTGSCPAEELTPMVKGAICALKNQGDSLPKVILTISIFGKYSPNDITIEYNACT